MPRPPQFRSRFSKRIGVILLASIWITWSTAAHAQEDFVGVRALGMGEAVRASATGAEGPLLNPSGMSLVKQYVIEGMYGLRAEDLGHHLNVSIVDSVTARIAAGLFYSFIYTSPKLGFNWAGGLVRSATLTRTGHVAGLSLSTQLGDRFFIGATVKYLNLSTVAPLPTGTVPSQLTLDSVNGISFDVGLTVKLGDKFHIAAVGYNLWDHGSRESPLSLGLALSFIPIPTLTINFDSTINFTGYQTLRIDTNDKAIYSDRITARLGPGIEWVAGGKVPIRAGAVYDTGLSATYLTLGLGYLSQSFGIDLSYRLKLEGGIENFVMAGIRLFVN